MTTRERSRAVIWFECAVLCLSMFYLCVHTLPQAWRTLNTDFPNYYLASELVHEHSDTSRMYEWTWIEREKDHRAVDIRVIGLLPITPFSTLAMFPLSTLKPLAAKHAWILLNLAFLIPLSWLLRKLTGLNERWIGVALMLNFPLYRNILFGQFYILLLLLLVAACWCYLRGHRAWAGALVALAAACKVFPVLLFLIFLQRRDWRALCAGFATGLAAIASSIAVFGWTVHRTWFEEILPWVTHGEGLQPYTVTASVSGILHRLFLSEPQWNPHPWHNSPMAYAVLFPVLQTLILAPAILLIRRRGSSQERMLLEWSAMMTAALAISTIPASYNFVLMVFPACVVASILYRRRRWGWLAALVLVYFGIGYPVSVPNSVAGLAVLFYVPRLPLLLALLGGIYWLLWTDGETEQVAPDWTRYAWGGAMLASAVLSAYSTLHLERAQRVEYAYRLPLTDQGFLNATPKNDGQNVRYVGFKFTGYHLLTAGQHVDDEPATTGNDEDVLSFAQTPTHQIIERAGAEGSQLAMADNPSHSIVRNGRDPMPASDGTSIGFIRDTQGRGRLMLHQGFDPQAPEAALTPPGLNVYEASFVSARNFVVAASADGGYPQLYATSGEKTNIPLGLNASRYPALSPDGRWLAYSHLEHGVWNLWLRDQSSGVLRRVADLPCNQMQPSWEGDSKTLLYATDCGRSVWFTAVARRRVIP